MSDDRKEIQATPQTWLSVIAEANANPEPCVIKLDPGDYYASDPVEVAEHVTISGRHAGGIIAHFRRPTSHEWPPPPPPPTTRG